MLYLYYNKIFFNFQTSLLENLRTTESRRLKNGQLLIGHIEGYVSEEIFNTGARIEWKEYEQNFDLLGNIYFAATRPKDLS
jgi:hypothetical protein